MTNIIAIPAELPDTLEDALDELAFAKLELEAMAEAHANDPDLLDAIWRTAARLRNAALLAVDEHRVPVSAIGARLLAA